MDLTVREHDAEHEMVQLTIHPIETPPSLLWRRKTNAVLNATTPAPFKTTTQELTYRVATSVAAAEGSHICIGLEYKDVPGPGPDK